MPAPSDIGLRERLRAALVLNGADLTVNQGLHSWRCEYPDSYGGGPCDCVDSLLDDLVAAARPDEVSDPDLDRVLGALSAPRLLATLDAARLPDPPELETTERPWANR